MRCSFRGPDTWTKPECERRAKEIVTKHGANSRELFERVARRVSQLLLNESGPDFCGIQIDNVRCPTTISFQA
jgi:hypothetical protein